MKTRIGIFVCHCGNNIGQIVNVSEVIKYVRDLPNVVHAEDNLYLCSEDSLSSLRQRIKEYSLNRVVVAACTPRTHEPLFKNICDEAGLNKYLFEFVNIREQCSWIHSQAKKEATEKAKSLIRMGVAKVRLQEAQEDIEFDVYPASLIIGGGIAGMTAALNLANQGFEVHLVEKQNTLGGLTLALSYLFPEEEKGRKALRLMLEKVKNKKNINVHTLSTVKKVEGYIGNFDVTIDENGKDTKFRVGTIIIATGARVFEPVNQYGYGQMSNVVTQLQLEELLTRGINVKNVVMINCVGARVPSRVYCSQICCLIAIKNAMLIKRNNPETSVYILHRDLMTYGFFEEYYRKAMEQGVKFIRYNLEDPPKVIGNQKARAVKVYDDLMGEYIELPCELVVLATPLIYNVDNNEISKMFKVPLTDEKFFLEAHLKLRPVEFATDGVYVCGSARWPANISEAVSQGYAAASKAAIPMIKGRVKVEAITSFCNERICKGCGNCVEVCPFGAVELEQTSEKRKVANVDQVKCKGCGCCVSACPSGAMQQRGFTDGQLLSEINSILQGW